jgi:predicted nucleic acid-binding protein
MLYPDTSFLIPLYVPQSFSAPARAVLAEAAQPCAISRLSLFEFRQAVRLQVFRHAGHRQQGFPRKQAEAVLRAFDDNLAAGAFLFQSLDHEAVLAEAERLSARHTETGGCRSFDLLHVAAALHWRADALLSFDQNQRQLAMAANLPVLPARLP